ncbi:von Willebrand factor C and EGF domain-containing protein [Grus japonensis]|uniref:von Willebrand factor C and EGF domain-containing protein n=1 Tax=Grus japonensis TaxID=30415 RepID=A0ABC9WW68_GRUJA
MLVELLFQAACVSLFLPGGQGRVYPGRKKLASFAVERRRVGPHVCFSGFGSGCCPGWMLSPGSGQCTLPLCSFGCGSGLCIAPNLCSCPDGEQGITCPELPGTCGEYGCDLSCNHGGCQEVARVCPLGFSMVETANGVRCTDIDECLSAACEGLCVNTEGGFVCECGPGMQLSADRHSCQDTDECLATPCQHRCKNSIGSYRCSCRPGYHLHGNRHSCVAGGCCPSCSGCLHEGVARAEGDVFSPSDGNCTVCVCLAGNISCISPECPPGSCPSASPADCCSCQPAKCSFRGRTYAHGTRFNLDGDDCTICVCRGGEVECSFAPCPVLDCPQHQRHLGPGQCCFTCRDPPAPAGCFVDDNGVEFPVGQIWSPGDPCRRLGCTYMGRIFYNNETFPSTLDPCLSCICLLGSVACSPVDCAIFCTYPFHPEGECCPVCNATDVRLLLQSSDLSLSPSHEDPPAGTPYPSPPASTRPPRHRLAQLLLPNTAPRPGSAGAGESPPTTLSPSGHPSAATLPPATPSEAAAPPAPTGSPSPEAQGPPGDADPSAVPPASGESPSGHVAP